MALPSMVITLCSVLYNCSGYDTVHNRVAAVPMALYTMRLYLHLDDSVNNCNLNYTL